jgi:hypothetical protein
METERGAGKVVEREGWKGSKYKLSRDLGRCNSKSNLHVLVRYIYKASISRLPRIRSPPCPNPRTLSLSRFSFFSSLVCIMSGNRSNSPHSDPIPINGHGRHRAMSTSSSGSPSSPPMLQTPVSPTNPFPPRIAASPTASPILSYFMAGSPTGKSNTFPFRRPTDAVSGAPVVFEGSKFSTSSLSDVAADLIVSVQTKR